jgi:hypothetical protein
LAIDTQTFYYEFKTEKMKKNILKTVFIVILAMMISNITKSQTYGSWVLPFDHNSNYEADRLQFGQNIQTTYLQDISSNQDYRFSAGAYDDNGSLLFYAMDYDVYDASSNYVGNFSIAGSSVTRPEIQIIRKPECDTVFYIVYSYHDNTSGGVEAFRYTEVTVGSNTGQVSLTYFGELSYYYNQAQGGAFAVSRIVDEERKLYRCTRNGITETLINSSGFSSNVTQLLSPYNSTIGEVRNFNAYNFEMKINDDCETTFAWFTRNIYTSDYDKVFIYNMDNDDVLKIDVDESSNGKICGIEFSSREIEGIPYDILYVSYKSDIPSHSGIIMIDYSNPNNIIRENITSQDNGFSHTFLQHAPDGDIYGVSDDGAYLGKIDEQTGQFTPDYFTYGEVISFMDVYDYDIYILPENENILTEGINLDFTVVTGGLACECPTNNPAGWAQVQNIDGCQNEPPYYFTWYDGNGIVLQEGTGLDYIDNLEVGTYSVCVEDAGQPTAKTCKSFNIILDPDLYNHDGMVPIDPTTSDWDNITDYTFREGIYVHANSNFTISNSYLQFGPNAKIIVEPTAKLTIDNTTLTYVQQCPCMWQGIEVWGNPNMDQFEHDGVIAQGQLTIENSTIENAEIAVRLAKAGTWNAYTGGIVYATNTGFSNNGRALLALPYTNHHPVFDWVEVDNVGHFNNCTFDITSSYIPDVEFFKHIDMNTVDGFKFRGCDFSLQAGVAGVSQWNQGIAAYSAGFDVKAICTSNIQPCNQWDKCTFDGFRKAINVQNSNSVYTFWVNRAVFNNNEIGVYASNVQNLSVLFSDFNIAKNTSDAGVCDGKGAKSSGYGIDLLGCTGFAIEENHFAPGSTGGLFTGIRCKDSQTQYDIIYKNTFDGLSYGNFAEGKNRDDVQWDNHGLEYRCNTNTDNSVDFEVTTNDPLVSPAMINGYQGYSNISAGNTFSQQSGVEWHFRNEGTQQIDYWWYTGNQIEEPVYYCDPPPEPCFFIPNPIPIENTCPSHYGGGGGGIGGKSVSLTPEQFQETELTYLDALYDYNNIKSLYDNLEDGGNTQVLKSEIETAFPSDMWQLRSDLLGVSPHVSKEVLKTAAEKTDIFPESVLFEILSANPDELKNGDMISFLENKENPLPEYMIDMLKQIAGGVTYKTILKRQMADFHARKSQAALDIVRSILADSILDMGLYRSWLDNLGNIGADKQIVASYVQDGDFTSAQTLLDLIPDIYGLTGDELAQYNDYKLLTEFQISLEQQNRNIFELDTIEIDYLVNIAEISTGTARTVARGILNFGYGYNYCDCLPADSSTMKSSVIGFNKPETDNGLYISAKPNPADTWVAFDFKLPSYIERAVLTITDIEGRVITSFPIDAQDGQKIWDARKIESGAYFYALEAGSIRKSGKLIIK